MFSKTDPGNHDDTGNSNSGQLLREIEAISNALYLRKPPQKALLLPADKLYHSARKTRFYETKAKPNPEFLREDVPHKERKISSVWNWKKPLKSLAHIGHRKFNCLFNLHVHSIDGLPPHFNGASLRVNWKRKDDVSQTPPSTVFNGMAEFNETLILKCSVYGGRSGPDHLTKYEPELFMIYVSVNGVPRLDVGKHWIDVTRLLPPTLEELEGEKSTGRWTTIFKLSGKANGALLQVSFGFLMMKDGLVKLGHFEVPKLLNLIQNRRNTAKITSGFGTTTAEMAQPVMSVPAHSVDEKICQEILLNPSLELSESIDFLYQKLDEGDFCGSAVSDFDFLKQMNLEPDPKFEYEKGTKQDLFDRSEFTVIDCGIEIDNEKTCNFDEVTENVIDKKMEHCSMNNIHSKYVDKVVKDENSLLVTKSTVDWFGSPSKPMFSARREPSLVEGKLLEQDNLTDVEASHQESIMLKGSSSLDDVNESVISDFLRMLGLECGSSRYSGCHPESPRELLLRQFEEETLASCNSFFYCDTPKERSNHGSGDLPVSGGDKYNVSFDFSPSLQVREEHKSPSLLRNRRKAQILENLETEALMQTWGIKEKDFQYSPRNCPAGFGSPIELPVEDPLKSPSLAEGCGSFVQLKGGGFLRSMNPALFKDSRNEGRLVIQLSGLVVIPAEMGSHFMEILQCFASIGADKLYMQINKLMSLEDLNEKTIPQIAAETASSAVGYDRKSLFQDNEIRVDYISPKDLIHLAMDKIEVLSLEGLKIQSDMSNEEAPSQISLFSNCKSSVIRGENSLVREFQRSSSDVEGLMDLSLPLDEWLKLDAGITGNNSNNHESIMKILPAHHAKSIDIGRVFTKIGKASSRVAGIMGNNLTLALMLQLKDPLRNLEPVGRPMLFLIQVERSYVHTWTNVRGIVSKGVDKDEDKELVSVNERPDGLNKGEGSYKYKINDIHLLCVNSEPGRQHVWGTTAQQVSGTRWLLANGIGKTIIQLHSKAKSLVRTSSTAAKMKRKDVLWSISSHVDGERSIWEKPWKVQLNLPRPMNQVFGWGAIAGSLRSAPQQKF